MTKEEVLNKPIPVLVGFLTNIYEDCQCTCACKFETWIEDSSDEEHAKRYAREHENKCKQNGIYDNCVERIVFERVLCAVKKETPQKILFNKNNDGIFCPRCLNCLGSYYVRRRCHTEQRYCPFCGQGLDWNCNNRDEIGLKSSYTIIDEIDPSKGKGE